MLFKRTNVYAKYSDLELIECYKNSQDKKYVDELFERYATLVFGVSMKYLKSEERSKDLTMAVFEKLFIELIKRKIDNFKPWLYQVTKNECLMLLRKQKAVNAKEEVYLRDEVEGFVEFEDNSHLFDGRVDKEKLLTQLEECIQHLKEEQRTCVQMFFLNEKCYHEVAEITSFDLKKVKSYIQTGKRNLKICLEKSL